MLSSNCASVPLVANIDGGNNGNGMFGNDSWIGLIIILALLSGGFGNGFGGFGGGHCGGSSCATQADLAAGFNNSTVLSSLDDIKLGQANAINYNNQGFAGLNTAVMQGFHGVDNAICTIGYQNQQGFSNLSSQLASCCCETQRSIDNVNYNMATQACDTRHAIQDSTRQILDFLTTDKIATLQAENQNLKLQASQAAQNSYLLSELKPCPQPAYITCNPFTGQYGGYGYNSCGCA